MKTSRRTFVVSAAAVAGTGSAIASRYDPVPPTIADRATHIRTIDPSDEDFDDLEGLGAAIGSRSVVQVGEPDHGAGSAFSAKARIVKYLYQRHGFDVVIWESGLYDVSLAQSAMRSEDDGTTAARRGVFALWSEASELKPLFDYVKSSQATTRPIEMAGFDVQVTAKGTVERFAEELRAFALAPSDAGLRSNCSAEAETAIAARQTLFATKFASRGDLDRLTGAAGNMRTMVARHRKEFEAVRSRRDISFMDRALANMQADAALRFEAAASPVASAERENRRDALNAANLRWLIEERYAGRKAVVWAHNAHIMNAYYAAGFHDIHLEPVTGDMKPSGVFLRQWLGDEIYTIGITAYEGRVAFATGGPAVSVAPAPPGSLEARLHAKGDSYAFIDLRAVRTDPRASVHGAIVARIPKFDSVLATDIARVYDGIFFIDQMAPATHS